MSNIYTVYPCDGVNGRVLSFSASSDEEAIKISDLFMKKYNYHDGHLMCHDNSYGKSRLVCAY